MDLDDEADEHSFCYLLCTTNSYLRDVVYYIRFSTDTGIPTGKDPEHERECLRFDQNPELLCARVGCFDLRRFPPDQAGLK